MIILIYILIGLPVILFAFYQRRSKLKEIYDNLMLFSPLTRMLFVILILLPLTFLLTFAWPRVLIKGILNKPTK